MTTSIERSRITPLLDDAIGTDAAALLLRLALGVMFIAHGATKVLVWGLPGTAAFFASIGLPGWLAWPITALELIGGVLLIAGIGVRWLALILAIELFAASVPHWSHGWMFSAPGGGWEYPIFMAVSALALALLGGGRYCLKRTRTP